MHAPALHTFADPQEVPSATLELVSLQTRLPPWQTCMPTRQAFAGVQAPPPVHCAPLSPPQDSASSGTAMTRAGIQ
jgi:hypothetical protein